MCDRETERGWGGQGEREREKLRDFFLYSVSLNFNTFNIRLFKCFLLLGNRVEKACKTTLKNILSHLRKQSAPLRSLLTLQ